MSDFYSHLFVGLISTVARASDVTRHNRVMRGSNPSWDHWSLGWKYHSKVGIHVTAHPSYKSKHWYPNPTMRPQ